MAYKLVPHASPPMYALPNSSHAIGGAWATKQLWVTPYSDTEKYPAGMHPYEKDGCIGLPDWTQAVSTLWPYCVLRSWQVLMGMDRMLGRIPSTYRD